jgi:acetolactate decarboxylase
VDFNRSTPFAIVTRFEPDGEVPCPRAGNPANLDAGLEDALGPKKNFLAVRVDGRFTAITLRSVHRQEPPYRPLDDVVADQSVWTRGELSGSLVSFRSPAWVGALNFPATTGTSSPTTARSAGTSSIAGFVRAGCTSRCAATG